jgi:short-subunit dehydrogenase
MEKSILITGCSSGIGLSAALTLQKKGYRVFATARNESDVEKLKSLGLESLKLDVNDSASIKAALQEILKKTHGTLDALFNNAGYVQAGVTEDLTRDMMRMQFETNVFGTMELTNLVIPIMRKQGHGRIIQNTSILGLISMPYRGAYNASKFALEGFTNTLRQELYGTQIFVSALVPGPIHSELREKAYHKFKSTIAKRETEHQQLYQNMEKHFFAETAKDSIFTLTPDAVTKKLLHALESKHPKAHYYVGFPAHLFAILRRLLSDNALDWIMNKISKSETKS